MGAPGIEVGHSRAMSTTRAWAEAPERRAWILRAAERPMTPALEHGEYVY
jgi:hypothetical protein